MAQRSTGVLAAAALAAGGCVTLKAGEVFVPAVTASTPAEVSIGASLRGSSSPAAGAGSSMPVISLLGAAGVVSAAASRTVRRAEPVSAAAVAAAAAKAATAAKGATATTSAVAGVAGAGSMTKGVKEGVAGSATASPSFDPAMQVGAMAPLGFFDPLGFSKKGDESGFRNLRAAEIKHGRVAMMAALGAVVQHYVKFPGFESVPTGLAASISSPGSLGFVALFAVAGALELGAWTENAEKEPGNFGDPAGLNQYTQEMRERELNNGRFAMFAAMGIIAAELTTGKDAIEQFGL